MGAMYINPSDNGDGRIMLFNRKGEYGWSKDGKIR
jgi:hypothetical protein